MKKEMKLEIYNKPSIRTERKKSKSQNQLVLKNKLETVDRVQKTGGRTRGGRIRGAEIFYGRKE